jgi:hypothetical protein
MTRPATSHTMSAAAPPPLERDEDVDMDSNYGDETVAPAEAATNTTTRMTTHDTDPDDIKDQEEEDDEADDDDNNNEESVDQDSAEEDRSGVSASSTCPQVPLRVYFRHTRPHEVIYQKT